MRLTFAFLCSALLVASSAALDGVTRLTGGRPERADWSGGQLITGPLPHEYIDVAALPSTFDWRDINGESFLTISKNQHIPQSAHTHPHHTQHT